MDTAQIIHFHGIQVLAYSWMDFIHKYIQDIWVILKSIKYVLMNGPIQR